MSDDVLQRVTNCQKLQETVLENLATSSHSLQKLSLYDLCFSRKIRKSLIRNLCTHNGQTLEVCILPHVAGT